MYPKTAYPNEFQFLLQSAKEGCALSLWQAAPLAAALAAVPGPLVLPEALSLPQPPEERLRGAASLGKAGEVYQLCALLVRLLSGAGQQELAGTADRRAALRSLAKSVCPSPEGALSLFRLLDRGLRLEPTRRFPDKAALLTALQEAEETLNAQARQSIFLQGTEGSLSGKQLPLDPLVLLGRESRVCRILFPPDARGVSRRHCRLALCWGYVLVTDLNSSYGTFLSGRRLSPQIPAPWSPGEILCLGSDQQALLLQRK